jgi:hypothetical protein
LPEDIDAIRNSLEELLVGMYESAKEDLSNSNNVMLYAKSDDLNSKKDSNPTTTQLFHPFRERMLFVLKIAVEIHNPNPTPTTHKKR